MKKTILAVAALSLLGACSAEKQDCSVFTTTDNPVPEKEVIFFENASDEVSNGGVMKLERYFNSHNNACWHDGYMIYLSGYANEIGDTAYNQDLSERRVQNVKDVLVVNGIKPWRIKTKAFGATRQTLTDDPEETLKINRRVVVELKPEAFND